MCAKFYSNCAHGLAGWTLMAKNEISDPFLLHDSIRYPGCFHTYSKLQHEFPLLEKHAFLGKQQQNFSKILYFLRRNMEEKQES